MTRLKTLFAAAAALVVGAGLTLSQALQQAAPTLDPPMTCSEWAEHVAALSDSGAQERFFIRAPASATIPQATNKGPLGACEGESCTISRADCDATLTYEFKQGATVNGMTIYAIRSHSDIAKAWKAWGEGRFLKSYKQAHNVCKAGPATDAECRALLTSVHECWRQTATGLLCRYGYTPGGEACTPDGTYEPLPCVVSRGAGSEDVDAARTYTDDELQ